MRVRVRYRQRGTLFEERVIWKYFSQICEALRHMHDRRILHRDLKVPIIGLTDPGLLTPLSGLSIAWQPANIFLTTNGVVKVGDLGLGRSMSEHSLEAHSKVGLTAPVYCSTGHCSRRLWWAVGGDALVHVPRGAARGWVRLEERHLEPGLPSL
jgi:NIMA (never in mitosis gene a)-related kinase 7